MARQQDQLLGHAGDNDGIEEYDNKLPDWWVGLFLFTILWAIGYGVEYHFISSRSQTAYYDAEITAAREQYPDFYSKARVEMTAENIAAGETIFMEKCWVCHGRNLEGLSGPNLIDAEWIYGGEPDQVVTTITEGRPNGMPAWGSLLPPSEVSKVAAFVLSKGEGG